VWLVGDGRLSAGRIQRLPPVFLVTEGEVLHHSPGVSRANESYLRQTTFAFGVFSCEQVTLALTTAQDLAGPGYFEPFRHALAGFCFAR
jgi:hypothetical protein